MDRRMRWLGVACMLSGIVGCAGSSAAGNNAQADAKPSYNEMKTMVVDILHGKDGTTAVRDVLKMPEFKGSLGMTQADIQNAVVKAMTQGQSTDFLSKQMKDPAFAAAMAKAAKDQHKELLKQLMKDPEYQQLMLTTMRDPDFQKQLLKLLETPPGRQAVMTVVKDSLKDPTFKQQFGTAIQEAAQASKGKGGQGGGGGGDGAGGGGGGGGDGGDGGDGGGGSSG